MTQQLFTLILFLVSLWVCGDQDQHRRVDFYEHQYVACPYRSGWEIPEAILSEEDTHEIDANPYIESNTEVAEANTYRRARDGLIQESPNQGYDLDN